MKKKSASQSAPARRSLGEGGFFNLRVLIGLFVVLAGAFLALIGLGTFSGLTASSARESLLRRVSEPPRYMPVPDGNLQGEAAGLAQLEQYWHDRLTYPTGRFDPAWVRAAAAQHDRMTSGVPAGQHLKLNLANPNALSTTNFTALGPQPERMTGCSGCYDYTTTEGRVNTIAVDPTTTVNGSIVAYSGAVGGGVWKTTNCCSASTTWTIVTDDPLISTTAIDTITIDPSNHNTVYAGTGDLNFGSFSMGSQGILKSADAGATWTVLGANVFGMSYDEPPGQFPQYNAVGKVRVDPNNSSKVVAGTKRGLYFSYNGGVNWTGPCTTNNFSTQRQDITGLALTNIGGNTRIVAAVGTRGFPTTVQYDLGKNGANGLYSATMGSSGCPSFTSIATNANGFVFGNQVAGSPYTTGAAMNAGSGTPCDYPISGGNGTCGSSTNQLGRIEIAVAPSNPNYIYAQAQSIVWNDNSSCGNTNGCQLGAWASTNGGTSWTYMEGSQGGALRDCRNTAGDYPQNWYNEGVAVDPNNPDRVFFDTFDVWFATRTGTVWNDTTCGYSYSGVAGPVHVDQHALAFLPGSSSILAIGNDGGMHGTTNADAATQTIDPTWFNMDTGINTIEFYSGDISGNFANAASPQASGGSQDNGSISVTFNGTPTGPVLWQLGKGGDGFYSRIDPVGTGSSLRFFQGNNSGGLHRCVSNCTNQNALWNDITGYFFGDYWSGDTRSFVMPYDLFHGGVPGGDDCPPAGVPGGCGHLITASTRVYETIHGGNASMGDGDWYITNNPTTQNMTKQTLGNRSFINQVKYSPKYHSVAMVGTNDANAWIGFNLGTGTASQANWVDVTGGNTVLPNRPIMGVALDPTVSAANLPVGYAAIGGFNPNTPSMPGHVFRVSCTANCGSFTWVNKTGNLPDIPVDSIIVNPNDAHQVYAGTDWGVYYTNDITVASPTWQRFENGIPHAMVWDMQIDRGSTTLSVWTRGRGAYVYPLPAATPTPTPTATPTATPTPTVQVTVQTSPAGRTFSVDGTTYSSIQTFSWASGSSHTIATTSPQNGATGVRYTWTRWSDNGAISHTVAPTINKTYTATFGTQYYLTMAHGTGGTVSPGSSWKNSGVAVSITATPTNNTQVSYRFSGWTGSGTGSYSGTNNPASITMNGPITENASFIQNPVQVTVQTSPAGLTFNVDGTTYTSAQSFSWQPGSSHTIATTSPQSGGTGVQYVWSGWTGGGAISHTVAPTTNKTYTATFRTQYYLTMTHGTGGTVSPASGWKNSGVAVSINAMPGANYHFSNWTGSGTGSYSGTNNPASITMNGPITETGTFTHN